MIKNIPSKNNEAYKAYLVLEMQGELKKEEVLETLESFKSYLKKLCSTITKRTPKMSFIYQWIFCYKIDNKDLEKYCKANLFAATYSLERIISKCNQQEITPVFRRLLIDFICDLKIFINYYDKSQNYEWLTANTNSHITNFYYDLARNVFYNGKPGMYEQEHLTLSSSTPFIIRQSIEYKIKRVLGIDYIQLCDKPHKTSADIYFMALRNNFEFYRRIKFDFEVIKKIHSWTNSYIHGGYRSRPWLTENALNYLQELFYAGETSQPQSLSLFAGIKILEIDLEDLLNKTEESIKNKLGKDAEIVWLPKPELAYITNVNDK